EIALGRQEIRGELVAGLFEGREGRRVRLPRTLSPNLPPACGQRLPPRRRLIHAAGGVVCRDRNGPGDGLTPRRLVRTPDLSPDPDGGSVNGARRAPQLATGRRAGEGDAGRPAFVSYR